VSDNVHDGQTEIQRGYRQIRTLQPQCRKSDNETKERGDQRGKEREKQMHHDERGSVSANGEKSGVSQ
jgi:hypothetical protein